MASPARMLRLLPSRADAPLAERRARGRALRKRLSRPDQGRWQPDARRADPLEVLARAERGRLPALLPIKHGRMAVSPFTFFRGAVPVMAADLARLPVTGLAVQICGDAHVRNLGAFAAPDGHLVFDINDFDETIRAPWEWDMKRLATSFVLAGRESGMRDRACVDAVMSLAASYGAGLRRFAEMPVLELLRWEISRHTERGPVHEALHKAERVSPQDVLANLTVRGRGPLPHFASHPPTLVHVSLRIARQVLRGLVQYRASLSSERQLVLDAYRPVDVAFKVVGTGSVGSRDFVVLAFGVGPHDPLVLQVKEEFRSAWAPYVREDATHEGLRVASGQRRMQTWTDPLVGWTSIGGRPFLVRQLADHKASVEPDDLRGSALMEYAVVSGELFAKAHARTGDAAAISGYCGAGPRFGRALARFALAYADQTTADHERFLRAIRAGRVKVRRGV
jgi:uncharacterized protein (DUF2252 family)